MDDLSKFSLSFELLGNIIIIDNSGRISFSGNRINKILSGAGIDIRLIEKGGSKDPDFKRLLTAIHSVRLKHQYFPFRFRRVNADFILFPADQRKKGDVIFALKKEMEHINLIGRDLKERVKELECLYSISRDIQLSKDFPDVLETSANHIKRAFQFPKETTVIIEFDEKKYISSGGKDKEKKNILKEIIYKNEKKRGQIQVIYHKKLPFLKEEHQLLKEISGKFSKAVDKFEKTRDLEKQKLILLLKNKKLIELTEECRQSREKLQAFFNAITDKIYVIDAGFNIVLSNSKEIGNTGKCYEKVFGSDHVCANCPALATFRKGSATSLEKEISGLNYLLQSFPILNADKKADQVIELCRDVTKEKKMEARLIETYKLASLGKLVAGVAHEINNPNTFILGNIKIIKEAFNDIIPMLDKYYKDDPSVRIARLNYELFRENITTLIDDIYAGSVRMKKIVEDLRSFAKKDDAFIQDTVNINSLIENTLRLVRKQLGDHVDVDLKLKHDIPSFTGNISKMEQVIVNMTMNASQAIGKEKGIIEITTDHDKNKNLILISIKDNGTGMDEKTRKSIFDPFFTTKRNEGGIGLGLSISYRIIKEHKGHIEVDSVPGKGTTFTIFVPIK